MHVEDLGEAVVFVLERWDPCGINAPLDENGKPLTYLNFGTGIDISIRNLSELISSVVEFK